MTRRTWPSKVTETKKLRNGHVVKLQQRGNAFDVLRNSTGLCFRYIAKAVSETEARRIYESLN